MRIYCGTYAKYNSGSIAGAWLDLADYSSKEEFYEACAELHEDEEDPEFMFQDMDGIPNGMASESGINYQLWDILEAVSNGADKDAIEAYIEWMGEWDKDNFEESYNGQYDSMEIFAVELVDGMGYLNEMPGHLQYYFDYEAFSRDLFMTDYYFANGYVFRQL